MLKCLGRLMILTAFISAATPVHAEVGVGEKAPNFTLSDIDGMSHHLSDYAGQMVVLEWMNPDCPFIRKHYETGNMQSLQEYYIGQGVVWLSINSSAPGKQGSYSPEEWKNIMAKTEAKPSVMLLDPSGEVGRLYGAKTTPHMFVVDSMGNLIYKGAIDDSPTPDPASVEEATNYVALALDAALAGEPVPVQATKSYGCSVKY